MAVDLAVHGEQDGHVVLEKLPFNRLAAFLYVLSIDLVYWPTRLSQIRDLFEHRRTGRTFLILFVSVGPSDSAARIGTYWLGSNTDEGEVIGNEGVAGPVLLDFLFERSANDLGSRIQPARSLATEIDALHW